MYFDSWLCKTLDQQFIQVQSMLNGKILPFSKFKITITHKHHSTGFFCSPLLHSPQITFLSFFHFLVKTSNIYLCYSITFLLTDCRLFKYCIQGYFHLMLFSPFFTCKRFRPVLNSPRQSCVQRQIIWDTCIRIRPVLNSLADIEGKRGENQTGRIFPCIQKW